MLRQVQWGFRASILGAMIACVSLRAEVPRRDESFQHLMLKAESNERVRVIVRMNVPNMEPFLARSQAFHGGVKSAVPSPEDPDCLLAQVIASAREEVLSHMKGTRFTVNRTYDTLPYLALSVTRGALIQLQELPQIQDVVEDLAVAIEEAAEERVTGISTERNESLQVVGADAAWDYGYSGAGWFVAVLDTGIRATHEMFTGKKIVEACFSSGADYEAEGGDCPNGSKTMLGPGSAAHYIHPDYKFPFAHGSHVTGIAVGNNKQDTFGVAKDADIVAINVFSWFPSVQSVMSWDTDQLKGLEYIYQLRNTYRIAAANLSLGGKRNTDFCDDNILKPAIDNLRAVGIATVIASGNEAYCGAIANPACTSTSVAVNGSTVQDEPYNSGNWDSQMVRLLAPGVSILSAMAYSDSDYTRASGTSSAAPHVAGAWAILKSFDSNLTVDEIQESFQSTGFPIFSQYCRNEEALPRLRLVASKGAAGALDLMVSLSPPMDPTVRQVVNRSWTTREYVNEITWESNPANAGRNVVGYRVYQVQATGKVLLAELDASARTFRHRRQPARQASNYFISSIDAFGKESASRGFDLTF